MTPETLRPNLLALEGEIWRASANLPHSQSRGIRIAGVDEAGRGPLAGPVVAAAVILPLDHMLDSDAQGGNSPPNADLLHKLHDIRDSKTLSESKRLLLRPIIQKVCIWSVAEASVQEIDDLNIHHATLLAMQRAISGLSQQPDVALIDGKFAPNIAAQAHPIVKGDSLSLSIAAASILAKTARDETMAHLDMESPGYGWSQNKGYPSKSHRDALATLGPSQHHRKSYAPVQKILGQGKSGT